MTMNDLKNQSNIPEMTDFGREYFIQTRKEIDTEKQERNKILNYAVNSMGSGLGAALKAAYLAGESPAPGIAYLPG